MKIITTLPSKNYDDRISGTKPDYLIIHYTACDLELALHMLTDTNAPGRVSSHYLIAETGEIMQLVDEDKCAWHAGQSTWKHLEGMNTHSIGIELVNPGHGPQYRDFTKVQMLSLLELSKAICKRHNIPAQNVLGHSDIAPGRKIDPGEKFDWAWLSKNGVGLFSHSNELGSISTDNVKQIQQCLQTIGYSCPSSGEFDTATNNAIKSFMMHYCPEFAGKPLNAMAVGRMQAIAKLMKATE